MQRSAITEIAAEGGARLLSYQGWEIPAAFADLDVEYHAGCQAAAVADMSQRAVLRVSGPERTEFLHSFLSNHVSDLEPGQGNHSTLMTPQGKLLGDMAMLMGEEEIRLILEPAARQNVFEVLDKYAILSEVEVEDDSARYGQLSVQGPQAAACIAGAGIEAPVAELTEPYYWIGATWQDTLLSICRSKLTEAGGYDVLVGAQAAVNLWQALVGAGAQPLGFEAFNVLRLEAGVPLYGADMDDSHIPVQANLVDAISYDKGCYVGQEVVAKIRSLGQVNRLLKGLVLDGSTVPPTGAKLSLGDEKCGVITSAVMSPKLGKPIALGYVRRKILEMNQALTVRWDGEQAVAVVVETPFSEAAPAIS